jgi:hypothetical protein
VTLRRAAGGVLGVAGAGAFLVGIAIGVDYSLKCQELQRGLDFGAKAGAQALAAGEDVEQAVRRRLSKLGYAEAAGAAVIQWPPRTGAYAGRREVVRVIHATAWHSALLPSLVHARIELRAASAAVPPAMAGGQSGITVRVE